MTVTVILSLAAFIVAVLAAMGRAPLWVPVLLLALLHLIVLTPLR